MCINSDISITTFIISVFSSFILIKFGLNKYKNENLIAGIFFIYVSFVQIFEFFIWDDINDLKWGGNYIASQLSALFIFTQPIILYLLKIIILKPAVFKIEYAVIELLFLIYVLFCYKNYIINEKVKSCFPDKTTGLLKWSRINYMDYIVYFSVFIFSIFIYIDFRYAILASLWLFTILDLTYYIVPKNYGALMCFLIALSPLIFLFWQIFFM